MILSYPILLASDAHTCVENLDKISLKHPEITNRFFLGDLFNFVDEQGRFTTTGNKETAEWLKKNIHEWKFILGNHCAVVCKQWWKYDIDQPTYDLVAGNFHIFYDLQIEDKKYLLVHSKPKDLWAFINPGYTFRELEEDFDNHEGKIIISGHVHKETIHNFQETETKIIQIGAARDGKYAILTKNGVEFKRL